MEKKKRLSQKGLDQKKKIILTAGLRRSVEKNRRTIKISTMLLLLLLPFASTPLAIARPPASHCLLPCQNLGLVGGKHSPTIRGVFQAFPLLSCALSFFSFLLVLSCPVLSYLSLTD